MIVAENFHISLDSEKIKSLCQRRNTVMHKGTKRFPKYLVLQDELIVAMKYIYAVEQEIAEEK